MQTSDGDPIGIWYQTYRTPSRKLEQQGLCRSTNTPTCAPGEWCDGKLKVGLAHHQFCCWPQLNACPALGKSTAIKTPSFQNPDAFLGGVCQNAVPFQPLECTYDINSFNNTDAVKAWRDTLISGGGSFVSEENKVSNTNTYNNVIMQFFCGADKNGSECPEGYTTCSRLTSQGEDGTLCREWANTNNTTKNKHDEIVNTRCEQQGTDDNDCACINRSLNSDFLDIRAELQKYAAGGNLSTECWWAACGDSERTRQLVPFLPTPTCDNTICVQDITIIAGRSVETQKKIEQNVKCGGKSVNTTTNNQDNTNNTFNNIINYFKQNPWQLWLLLGIIVILIVFLFFVIAKPKHQAEKSKVGVSLKSTPTTTSKPTS